MERHELVETAKAFEHLRDSIMSAAEKFPVIRRNPAALMAILGVLAETIPESTQATGTKVDDKDMATVATYLRILKSARRDSNL